MVALAFLCIFCKVAKHSASHTIFNCTEFVVQPSLLMSERVLLKLGLILNVKNYNPDTRGPGMLT